MKRILALLLTTLLLLSFTSCELLGSLLTSLETGTETAPGVQILTDGPETKPTEPPVTAPPATEAKTEPKTEPVTEPKTEPVTEAKTEPKTEPVTEPAPKIDKNGKYYDYENVILYVYTYSKLPSNFITKKQAESKGWEGGSVDKYVKGSAIGGDYFGNYEGILPKKDGRKYTECDIDTKGKARGAKRVIYSNDGLFFYTTDHYETFTEYTVKDGKVVKTGRVYQ